MNRAEKIDWIIEYAGDEFESGDDFVALAKKSDTELDDTIESIEDYIDEN